MCVSVEALLLLYSRPTRPLWKHSTSRFQTTSNESTSQYHSLWTGVLIDFLGVFLVFGPIFLFEKDSLEYACTFRFQTTSNESTSQYLSSQTGVLIAFLGIFFVFLFAFLFEKDSLEYTW